MFVTSLSPEDLCITNEVITKGIRNNSNKEWKSQREFLEYMDRNYKSKEWKVIGYITSNTIKKWYNETIKNNTRINKTHDETESYWILIRGKEYWFVRTMVLSS